MRFKRIPTRLVQTCPNCRRLLRLQDKMSVAEGDQLQLIIDEFVSRDRLQAPHIAYADDPRLDQVTTTEDGVLHFQQPWPEGFTDVLYEHTEVELNPHNEPGNITQRQHLLRGYLRRVTVERTGEIEQMTIIGHWRDRQDDRENEGVVGLLPRKIVRELNRLPYSTLYAAKINSAVWVRDHERDLIELYVDVARSPTEHLPPRSRMFK